MFFYLNNFKKINDLYGRAEGDNALKTFTDVLRIVFRECDVVGRLGGDEFLALLTGSKTLAVIVLLKELLEESNATLHRGYAIRLVSVRFIETPVRFVSRGHRLAHIGCDACIVTSQDLSLFK